ncbi:hypothetical protein CsatB_028881 [Cannabis sativa]
MVNTRSSLSPSGSSKLLLDKLKMKKTISEDDNEDLSGGSEGSGDVSVKEVKRKQYNRGNKKVTDDRPLKKLKQVVEYDEDFYDSDDLEVENNESMKEWELYFKHEDRVGGRIIFFPNHENNVIAIINSKLTPSQAKLFRETCFGHFLDMNPIAMQTQLIHSALHREVHQKNPYEMWFKFGSQNFRFSLAEFAVVTGLLCVGDSDMSGYAKKENAFVDKYFSDQQVTVSAVEERFRYSDFKLDEYAVKMAVLYFVSNCLFTSPNSKKVPNEILNIVGIGDYESFPWGKLVFKKTLHNLRIGLRGVPKKKTGKDIGSKHIDKRKGKAKAADKESSRTYKLPCFPYAFLVWIYETIPLCQKAGFCEYDSDPEYRICRWLNVGLPNNSAVERKVFSSPKLKGEYIFPTDEERSMLNLSGLEFIEKEDSDVDVDRVGAIGLQSSILNELRRDVKKVIQKQLHFDGSFEGFTSDIKCRFKELELNMISHIDSKIDESLQFYLDLKFNDLKEKFDDLKASQSVVDIRDDSGGDSDDESGLKDGVNVDLAVKDDLVMKEVDDVDLVTENVKDYSIDPVLNLAESGGVLVNEGDTVVEGEGLQNVGDGGLVKEGHTALLGDNDDVPSFDIMGFLSSQPDANADKEKRKKQDEDDHAKFKDLNKKSKDDEDDGDDQGMGGDVVSSIVKEVIKGINEGDDKSKKGGSVTKDDVGGEARKNMVDSSAIDVVVAGVIGSPNLFDSQGTEDSITLSAMEIINEKIETIEGSLKKEKNLEANSYEFAKRVPNIGSALRSPFTSDFGSIGSSSKPKGEQSKLLAFSSVALDRIDDLQSKLFEQWFKVGFNDRNKIKKFKERDRKLKVPLDFAIMKIDDKMWFYDLLTPGRNFSCSHLDVCFYYLRKEIKYNESVNSFVNTTDCLFAAQIFEMYNEFVKNDCDIESVKKDSKASAYVAGFGMYCSRKWIELDNVLMPINLIDLAHWIMCIFDIRLRCLKVCNSMRFGRYKNSEKLVRAFAVMLPILLSHVNFYDQRKDIDKSTGFFQGKSETDPLKIVIVQDLPQQEQCDCGVFVIKYAEYFIHGLIDKIPKELDIPFVRKKLCVELFVHAKKKEVSGYESPSEYPGRMEKDGKKKK